MSENVAEFKYLETLTRNWTYFHDQIKGILNSGKTYCVSDFFFWSPAKALNTD